MDEMKPESALFRGAIGLLCVVGSFIGFGALYFIEVPEGNREPLLLALGIVFGWGSSVVSSEYGSTSTGRKVADSAIRTMEQQSNVTTKAAGAAAKVAADVAANSLTETPAGPTGNPGDPVSVVQEEKP